MGNKYVEIYVDGACSGNPGPGGWGVYLKYGNNNKKTYVHEINTTNNRMEIQAAIEALQFLRRSCSVIIYTDSLYLKNGITLWLPKWTVQNFRKHTKKPIKNIDLWQKLNKLIGLHEIDWKWVKGHSDNEGNNLADLLARKGRDEAKSLLL